MFAVIKTGGKQYKVAIDDVIAVEKLAGNAGDKVEIDNVLMVGEDADVTVGQPLVEGAKVKAELVEQGRADKIIVFKKKRRQNYRRTKGHRQHQTMLKIIEIAAKGKSVKSTAKPATKKAEPENKTETKESEETKAPAAKKPATKKTAAKKTAPKAATKKTTAKKSAAKKTAAKKTTPKKG